MSSFSESFPTPRTPLPGEKPSPDQQLDLQREQNESLREAKQLATDIYNFLQQFERKDINVEGKRYGFLVVEAGSAPITAGGCVGFIVSVDIDTGEITATSSSVIYSGSTDPGYTVPTWIDTGLPLPDGGGTVAVSGTFLVWGKITYSAADSTYGTSWILDNVEFDFGAVRPVDSKPSYNFTTGVWSGSGAHYFDWATIVDRVVISTFGGGIILKICSPDEIITQPGCQ